MTSGYWQKLQNLHIDWFSITGTFELCLFLLYGHMSLRYGPIFKISMLDIKLGHWQKFQMLHMHSLSKLGGGN